MLVLVSMTLNLTLTLKTFVRLILLVSVVDIRWPVSFDDKRAPVSNGGINCHCCPGNSSCLFAGMGYSGIRRVYRLPVPLAAMTRTVSVFMFTMRTNTCCSLVEYTPPYRCKVHELMHLITRAISVCSSALPSWGTADAEIKQRTGEFP